MILKVGHRDRSWASGWKRCVRFIRRRKARKLTQVTHEHRGIQSGAHRSVIIEHGRGQRQARGARTFFVIGLAELPLVMGGRLRCCEGLCLD